MKAIQRVIYVGFAVVALASAAMPVFPGGTATEGGAAPGADFDSARAGAAGDGAGSPDSEMRR